MRCFVLGVVDLVDRFGLVVLAAFAAVRVLLVARDFGVVVLLWDVVFFVDVDRRVVVVFARVFALDAAALVEADLDGVFLVLAAFA